MNYENNSFILKEIFDNINKNRIMGGINEKSKYNQNRKNNKTNKKK